MNSTDNERKHQIENIQMKTNNPFSALGLALREAWVLPLLVAALNFLPADHLTAQTFTTLHSFTAGSGAYPMVSNIDGANPFDGLLLSGNKLYGTTFDGGTGGIGTVFAVNTDGTGFTALHTFAFGPYDYTNTDGAFSHAPLTVSGNTLYGTARAGGSTKSGTVFAVNTDGTGFTTLHDFISDGANPEAGLVLSGNTLYGTTLSYHGGTVFAVNTDGTGFTNLHIFTDLVFRTNSDGANPEARLVLSGNTLYGTASVGGPSGRGTVFAINTDGTGFTNLYRFTATSTPYPGSGTNSDGSVPYGGLILSGNTLYGTATYGGSSGEGTVFAVHTDGSGFANLHNFTAPDQTYNTNSDGVNPEAGLTLSGNTLYGTARSGGTSAHGTVFAVNTDGTGFTTLYNFTALSTNSSGVYTNSDGAIPYCGLILANDTLYGTSFSGGNSGNGTVFSLSFQPQLSIAQAGANVILSWPTNFAGFDYTGYTLQSTTNLTPPVVWTTNSPAPLLVNGLLTVTNPISGAQQFYQLVH